MKDKGKLTKIIEKYILEPYKSSILNEVKPSIRLKTTGENSNKIGRTKLGGHPDLPQNITWPKSNYDGRYLSFLGQINCEELNEYDLEKVLPHKGILYFFFNLDSGDDGKVIFSEDFNNLETAVPPEELQIQMKSLLQRLFSAKSRKRIFKESQVEIYNEYFIPSWDSLQLEKIQKIKTAEIEPIDAFLEGFADEMYEEGETETTPNHHLFGNYNGIQNEFHQLNFINIQSADVNELKLSDIEDALKWKLLFQFDSDENIEMVWGDLGRIYFFIHEADLENKLFENVKISADCY
jgi:uncharacterized protein YwqG